ncbi:MAG: RCC1 domain-containing protein [Sandaracinaceae bacterium]
MNRRLCSAVLFLLLASCDGGENTLLVDLRTDMVPMAEFTSIEVERLTTDGVLEDMAAREAVLANDLIQGERVAQFDAVPPGDYVVRVRLRAGTRTALVSDAQVTVRGDTAMTVTMTRSCRGVECASGRCLGGACVDAACSPENPDACEPPECEGDGDCAVDGAAACASPRCADGTCLAARGDDECADGEYCDPELGCAPVPTETVSGCVRDVALGTLSTCILFTDGHVECRGYAANGQLGRGTTLRGDAFEPVMGIEDAQRLVGVPFGYCVIRVDGTVWCWGENSSGRFGQPPAEAVTRPVRLPVDGATDVAFGSNAGCVVTKEGEVYCMGVNELGQLMDGTRADAFDPPARADLPIRATAVAAGWAGACALLEDGTLRCAGYIGYDSVGTPSEIGDGLTGLTEVSAHAPNYFARRRNGEVWSFGRNGSGELGLGTLSPSEGPTRVPMAELVSVASGDRFGCGVRRDGTVQCWGDNRHGRLGDETAESSPVPVTVPGVSDALYVRASQEHACVMTRAGELWCWGHNCCAQIAVPVGGGAAPQRLDYTCPAE